MGMMSRLHLWLATFKYENGKQVTVIIKKVVDQVIKLVKRRADITVLVRDTLQIKETSLNGIGHIPRRKKKGYETQQISVEYRMDPIRERKKKTGIKFEAGVSVTRM